MTRPKELRPIPRRDRTKIEFVFFADRDSLTSLFQFVGGHELNCCEAQPAEHRSGDDEREPKGL